MEFNFIEQNNNSITKCNILNQNFQNELEDKIKLDQCNNSSSSNFDDYFNKNEELNILNENIPDKNEINNDEDSINFEKIYDPDEIGKQELLIENNEDNKKNLQDIEHYETSNHIDSVWIKNKILEKKNEINEFENILNNNEDVIEKEFSDDKLELLFNKIILKNIKKSSVEIKEEDKNLNIFLDTDKNKVLTILCKKINSELFLESTRGYNIEKKIYILNLEKLMLNLNLFNYNHPEFTIGILYRDFMHKNFLKQSDINNYWIMYNKCNKIIDKMELLPNNKILKACLENFTKTHKFKKTIGKKHMRFFKKTVELTFNKLEMDIIFYASYI